MRIYRQGDVLLVSTDTIPTNLKKLDREHGRVVLAHGEMTGHHHSIVCDDVDLLTPDGSPFVSVDEAAELYLAVHCDPVDLTHQEHATITIQPGNYRVIRQREYTPERIIRVAD